MCFSLMYFTYYNVLLLFIVLILVGVELPLCIVVTLSRNAITVFWSQAEYKIVLFYSSTQFNVVHMGGGLDIFQNI